MQQALVKKYKLKKIKNINNVSWPIVEENTISDKHVIHFYVSAKIHAFEILYITSYCWQVREKV